MIPHRAVCVALYPIACETRFCAESAFTAFSFS